MIIKSLLKKLSIQQVSREARRLNSPYQLLTFNLCCKSIVSRIKASRKNCSDEPGAKEPRAGLGGAVKS